MPQLKTTPCAQFRLACLSLVLSALGLGCSELLAPVANTQVIEHLKLTYELAPGWEVDPSVVSVDPAKGGLLLRLQPRDRIAGSPKLEIRLDPLRVKPVTLDAFVQETIGSLRNIEQTGGAKTVGLENTPTQLLGLPAVRLDHQYTIGTDLAQLSVSQSTWVTMIDGRATVFSVSGRTELTTPRMVEIESLLGSLAKQSTGES